MKLPTHINCETCTVGNKPKGKSIFYTLQIVWWMGVDSLVDGGGLRTFLCDPMHTLRSSGYTLSGIYPAYKSIGFGRCAHPRKKKVVLAGFLIVIHQTRITNSFFGPYAHAAIFWLYTLWDIYFLNLHHPAYKSMDFCCCAHHRKKSCFSSLFNS